MKKMIFAMTIATGMLTASFANAQKAEKTAPKTQKQAPVKAKTESKNAVGETPKKTVPTAKPNHAKYQAAPAGDKRVDGTQKAVNQK